MTWREWFRRELESIPGGLINFSLFIAIIIIVFGIENVMRGLLTLAYMILGNV